MCIRCSNCQWEQDDFWSSDGHNPLSDDNIRWWKDIFAKGMAGRKVGMEKWMAEESGLSYDGEINEFVLVDFRDYLASELEIMANRFRNMTWVTENEFRADTDHVCPRCGCNDCLSVD